MQKIDSFLQEFSQRASEYDAVESTVLFGSGANGTWHPGSDLDLVVVLSHNDDAVKKELVDLFWELDEKYGTSILDARMMHPPIIFLDKGWKKDLCKGVCKSPLHATLSCIRQGAEATQKARSAIPRFLWVRDKNRRV